MSPLFQSLPTSRARKIFRFSFSTFYCLLLGNNVQVFRNLVEKEWRVGKKRGGEGMEDIHPRGVLHASCITLNNPYLRLIYASTRA